MLTPLAGREHATLCKSRSAGGEKGDAMRLSGYWPANIRIIEFGAHAGAVGSLLRRSGYWNYLGVAGRRHAARQHPRSSPHLTIATPATHVRRNNAEVLILHGWSWLHLVRFRSVRHARYVAWSVRPTPAFGLACLVAIVQCLLGRLAWPVVLDDDSPDAAASPRLLVFRVRRPRPYGAARRFVPHRLGMTGFLRRLQAEGVRHVVLRWFELLPEIPPGEDLDLLVDDASLQRVRAMLDEGPGLQPIDLYSVTGLPGADFRSMPYYPPYLAERLLDGARLHTDLCIVPSTRDHFLSLAYHALYHKGFASKLRSRGSGPLPPAKMAGLNSRGILSRPAAPDHDYAAVLRDLSRELGLDVSITLEDLDQYLDTEGWRPPHDMLVRLSRRNRWVRSLVGRSQRGAYDDRLAVFLLRREALSRGGVERAERLLQQHGFQVVKTLPTEPRRAESIAKSIRGGNWGRGPWPIAGGPPVAAIVTYDLQPVEPTRRQRKRFPFLANARLLAKEQIRDAFNDGLPPEKHCNCVHSSDNGREAMDYLRIIAPEAIDELLARVQHLTRSLPHASDCGHARARAA